MNSRIIFREEVEGLKNSFIDRLSVYHVLSREHSGSDLLSGRITAEKCARIFDKIVDPHEIDDFFISVDLNGGRLLVGETDAGDDDSGAASLYRRGPDGQWAATTTLRSATHAGASAAT